MTELFFLVKDLFFSNVSVSILIAIHGIWIGTMSAAYCLIHLRRIAKWRRANTVSFGRASRPPRSSLTRRERVLLTCAFFSPIGAVVNEVMWRSYRDTSAASNATETPIPQSR